MIAVKPKPDAIGWWSRNADPLLNGLVTLLILFSLATILYVIGKSPEAIGEWFGRLVNGFESAK